MCCSFFDIYDSNISIRTLKRVKYQFCKMERLVSIFFCKRSKIQNRSIEFAVFIKEACALRTWISMCTQYISKKVVFLFSHFVEKTLQSLNKVFFAKKFLIYASSNTFNFSCEYVHIFNKKVPSKMSSCNTDIVKKLFFSCCSLFLKQVNSFTTKCLMD